MNDPAYPAQDPADLRAGVVRDEFDAIRREVRRYAVIMDRYQSQVRNPERNGQPDYKVVSDARQRLDRTVTRVQGVVLEALETAEVKVIHDTPRGT